MFERIHRLVVFAMLQVSIVAGIVLLPVAVLLAQMGITIPLDRPVNRLAKAYERAD